GRYGGDEFLIVQPHSAPGDARELASELLEAAREATVMVSRQAIPISLSVGIAAFPEHGISRNDLIATAYAAMYQVKQLGGGEFSLEGRVTRSLEASSFGALSGLVRAVDRKDRFTKVHSELVRETAVRFCQDLGLSADQIEALEIAGELHDIGKIAVPDAVLCKPGHLSDDDRQMMQQHVIFSELMVKGVPHLPLVLEAIANHHERWDGDGYPFRKRGASIPLLGRIMALADAYSAMVHDRPYRKGRHVEAVIAELRAGAGTQFDPEFVEPYIVTVRALALEQVFLTEAGLLPADELTPPLAGVPVQTARRPASNELAVPSD
nr:diguanylate cyclase [Chloroflexota bacterium]